MAAEDTQGLEETENNGSDTTETKSGVRRVQDFLKASVLNPFITFIFGITLASFVYWLNTKEPHLRQEVSEIVPIEVEKGKLGVITASVVNDGNKVAEKIEVLLQVPGYKIEEPKVIPANVNPVMVAEGDTIKVNLDFLNPKETERLQITGLVRSTGKLPDRAYIRARGIGVVGETIATKRSQDNPSYFNAGIAFFFVSTLMTLVTYIIQRLSTELMSKNQQVKTYQKLMKRFADQSVQINEFLQGELERRNIKKPPLEENNKDLDTNQ